MFAGFPTSMVRLMLMGARNTSVLGGVRCAAPMVANYTTNEATSETRTCRPPRMVS